MTNVFTAHLLKQHDVVQHFKFDLKKKSLIAPNPQYRDALTALVRPRLKIAIVTETWPPELNGVAHSLLHFSRGLQQRGHKILLIRPEPKTAESIFYPEQECFVKAQAVPRYAQLQWGWPQLHKVSQALSRFAPDVVHIVTEGPLGLAALQAAKQLGIPVSSGFHSSFQDMSRFFDLAFLLKPVQRYLRWFHNQTDLTCVPSADTEHALRQFGVTCPLVVVGRGVAVDSFHPQYRSMQLRRQWGATPDTRVLLSVGRLSPEKEIPVLIHSYHAMLEQGQDVKLVIVGDGPEREHLIQLNKKGNIIFTGNLSGIELATAYASADVFVFASQVETFGNVVLEAMASGLPVIAYDHAAAHLYVQHGDLGWLSPRGDQERWKQHLLQLPENKKLNYMGLQARQAVLHLGWDYPVGQLEQALYAVARESHMYR